MAVGHVIASQVSQVDSRAVDTLFNWIVPIGLVVGMIKYTESYAARARAARTAHAQAAPRAS
jgi:hypothetical protein